MPSVADHEGRTSVKEAPKALLIFPAVPLNKIKKQLLLSRIKTGEEIFWFQLFFVSSAEWPLNNAIMNINKEKTPKTIQLSKKFTAAIERKDIKNRMRRTALTIFPKLTISKNTKESNPMNPKNIEKSFQPPIKLEVLFGNMLKGIMLIPKTRWRN